MFLPSSTLTAPIVEPTIAPPSAAPRPLPDIDRERSSWSRAQRSAPPAVLQAKARGSPCPRAVLSLACQARPLGLLTVQVCTKPAPFAVCRRARNQRVPRSLSQPFTIDDVVRPADRRRELGRTPRLTLDALRLVWRASPRHPGRDAVVRRGRCRTAPHRAGGHARAHLRQPGRPHERPLRADRRLCGGRGRSGQPQRARHAPAAAARRARGPIRV